MNQPPLRPGLPPAPARILKLPREARGFPVPFFVQWFREPDVAGEPGQGEPDFRVVDGRKLSRCVHERLCWVCGELLGRYLAFTIGPMCAVNRISAEPPAHRECATWSAQACPFLTLPKAQRRDAGLHSGVKEPAGTMLRRNPGVTLVWIAYDYKLVRADGGTGALFRVGDPIETLWYAEGRIATRAEILASIESGLPIVQRAAEADGPDAVAALQEQLETALALVPA